MLVMGRSRLPVGHRPARTLRGSMPLSAFVEVCCVIGHLIIAILTFLRGRRDGGDN